MSVLSQPSAPLTPRNLELDDASLKAVCDLVYRKTGIVLTEAKRDLVQRRLSKRLQETGALSIVGYLQLVQEPGSSEEEQFINAMTTNLTSFFRESHHFDYLRDTVIPEIQTKRASGSRKLRIWSAGCSTGEEPYSIAITLREAMPDIDSWDARVLCTDLDSQVVQTAKTGQYKDERFDKMPKAIRNRWFQQNCAKQPLKDLLVFKQLNLLEDWPMKGKFDVIFCRNVVIYFDRKTKDRLVSRYHEFLEDDGYLILGHSESLFDIADKFSLIGKTIYRKVP